MLRFAFLAMIMSASWAAQDAEVFTLKDGRVIVGNYDPATKRLQSRTASGVMSMALEPEEIDKRKPYVARKSPAEPLPDSKSAIAIEPKSPEPQPIEAKTTPRNSRDYYIAEKKRLEDDDRIQTAALFKELDRTHQSSQYQARLQKLRTMELQYRDLELEVKISPDGERRTALNKEWGELEVRYNNLVKIVNDTKSAMVTAYKEENKINTETKEKLQTLEYSWRDDGYSPNNIPNQ